LDDVDDEVRDRAAMYLRMFKESFLADAYVKEGESPHVFGTRDPAYRILESVFSLDALESKLVSYVNDPSASITPFDASSIPKISRAQAAADAARKFRLGIFPLFSTHATTGPSSLETVGAPAKQEAAPIPQLSAAETQSAYVQQLKEVPELAMYGVALGSSKPVQLTESETEYQVTCVKHIFAEHIVFQVRGSPLVAGWH
jgi:coatomer subunit gamma